jgi:septal ring factor EnvC (AmiA/AmiB activator)
MTMGSTPSTPEFHWPAMGRIIRGFGAQPDSTTSKGIHLAFPRSTEILAVEGGVVLFAGSRRGYGNVICLGHDHGYVSVYGNLGDALVKVGHRVRQDQIIGRSGLLLKVDGTQQWDLEFELRKDSLPVDPLPLLRVASAASAQKGLSNTH